ncbi:putative calcium-activated chloride channel regulator 4, partial [Halenospora varia]
MRFSNALQSVALFSIVLVANVSAFALEPRASQAATCAGLSVKSNDGNRKVALVLDSSGSMTTSDPYNLRRAAGRALNGWLVTNAQASGSRKADLVTVIDFDDRARVVYPLGDPGGANSSFDSIDSSGGTYIAGGVMSAISQLTKSGSGDTKGRTSIIVFTDGEDSSVSTLVTQIKAATSLGIRVSFGFLDLSSATQSKSVLEAIKASGGVYATITTGDASNNFINFAILNGLTQNDNPSGNANTLLAGLSVTYPISQGSVFYNAQSGEHIRFTVKSIDAGPLSLEAVVGGKTANTTTTSTYGSSYLNVSTPNAGQIELKVSAKSPSSSS